MGNPIQLPVDVQSILDASDPRFQGANAAPQIPGTSLPPAPPQTLAAPAAPDLAPPTGTGTLADKISAAFLTHLAQNQPPPIRPQQPQQPSTAQKVAGAAQNVMSSLSDASHATDVKGGGWLSGITSTLAARQQRLSQSNQQQFENAEQKRKDDALIARNQVETLQLVRNIYQQDQQTRGASYAQGKSFVDSLRGDHAVTDNVSQSDLNSLIQKNPAYLQSHYVRPVGEEPVLDGSGAQKIDANGNPVFSPTYSLVDRTPSHPGSTGHKITPEESAYFKTQLGTEYPEGTQLTIDQYAALSGQAHKVADTTAMINRDRETALSDAQRAQMRSDLADDNIQHYIASVPGSALGGLYRASKNADDHIKSTQQQIQAAQQKADANAVQPLQGQLKNFQDESAKVNRVITNGFSDKDRDAYQRDIEKERHDQQEEAERQSAERDRNAGKAKQKLYDDAHQAWQDSLAANDFNPIAARESLRKSNPKALSALADEETRSAQVTSTEDPITGETRQTMKSKPTFFAVPGQSNAASNPQTVADLTPAVANFQKSQDQEATAQRQQQQSQQDQDDQRPAEKPSIVVMGQVNPNGKFNKAEEYISQHPELSGPDRAAVRKQYAQSQQTSNLPKPPQQGAQMPPAVAAQYLQANGGNKDAARKAAQAAGWSF